MKQKYDYVLELKRHFEVRTAKNSSYSLRAYARDLDMIPSRLSEVLNHKKGLSEESARKVARKLGLNATESEFFILSVKAQHGRSQKEKDESAQVLKQKLIAQNKVHQIDGANFEMANNWYHLALLELMELKECDHSLEWFARKLNLNKTTVKAALERLLDLKWITFKNGKYQATFEQSESSYDIPSAVLKAFHVDLLKKAEQSLYFDGVDEREFLNMTLAFSTKQMQEAKEEIRKFQKEFAEKFYPKNKDKDSVYQLSIQLFRLDASEGN